MILKFPYEANQRPCPSNTIVLAIAEQDPIVLVLRTRKRTVLVLVLDGSYSMARTRWLVLDGSPSIAALRLFATAKRHAAMRFVSSAFDSPSISKIHHQKVR